MSQEDIDRLKSSVNLGAKVEKRVLASQLLYSASNSVASTEPSTTIGYKTEFMTNPIEKITNLICERTVVGYPPVDDDNTESEILRQLLSMNARLSRIEDKLDKISTRLDRVERNGEPNSSLSNLVTGLSFLENGFRNIVRLED